MGMVPTVCVCGAVEVYMIGEKDGLGIGRCRDCDMIRTVHRPDDYERLYTTSEYHWGRTDQQPYVDREEHDYSVAANRWPKLLKHCKALDVGCANGGFVRYLAEQGAAVEGFELNPDMARFAASRSGRPVHTAWSQVSGPYDWVFLHDVLEHTVDPIAELRRLRGVMYAGGLLVIEIPDADHISFDRGRADEWRSWRHMKPREHLWHWGAKDIARIVGSAGFLLEDTFAPIEGKLAIYARVTK